MQFVIDFLDYDGLDRLERIMEKSAGLPQEAGDVTEQVVGEVLKCLRVIMNVDVSLPTI